MGKKKKKTLKRKQQQQQKLSSRIVRNDQTKKSSHVWGWGEVWIMLHSATEVIPLISYATWKFKNLFRNSHTEQGYRYNTMSPSTVLTASKEGAKTFPVAV